MSKIPLYIMSCDKNHDVLEYCLQSISINLSINNFMIYVGTNTENSKLSDIVNLQFLKAPRSSWRTETLHQLYYLKNAYKDIDYLCVLLDDFVIRTRVNQKSIRALFDDCKFHNIQYLKLKAPTMTIRFFLKKMFVNELYSEVDNNHPYYSSLQIAVWNIDHLIWTVENSNDIWDFERIRDTSIIHYSVNKSVVNYKHVIEKGKWDINSKKYIFKIIDKFNPGDRAEIDLSTINYLKVIIKRYILFPLFGYSIMKLKSFLRMKI